MSGRRTATLLGQVLAATVVGVMPVYLLGSLAVAIDLGRPLTAGRLGAVTAVFWASSAACSWPAGRLAQRVGALRGLAVGMAVTGAATLGAAVSGGLVTFGLCMALGGAGNAFVVPACNLALARGLPYDRQGTAFGLKQAAISSGALAAGLAVPATTLTGGWRGMFLVTAGLAACCAGAAVRGARFASAPDPEAAPAGAGTASSTAFLVLAVAAAMGSATNTTLTAFFVSSAVKDGRDPKSAGLLLGVGAALGIGGRLVMGRRADRRPGTGLPDIRFLLLLGAPGFMLLAFPASTPALLAGTALAFGAGWGWTGLYHMAVVRLRPHAPAAATGATQTGMFLGGLVGPWLFGMVAGASYRLAWTAAGIWLLLAALGVHTAARLLPAGDLLTEGRS